MLFVPDILEDKICGLFRFEAGRFFLGVAKKRNLWWPRGQFEGPGNVWRPFTERMVILTDSLKSSGSFKQYTEWHIYLCQASSLEIYFNEVKYSKNSGFH